VIFGLHKDFIFFVIGLLGIVSMLQNLPDVRKKQFILRVYFGIGILSQALTQVMQYQSASWYRVAYERKTAFALHAFTCGDIDLLKRLANDNPYLIGYNLFKKGEYKTAEVYLQQSLDEGSFVAPSHYLLAHVIGKRPGADITVAMKHLDAAIVHDREYAAAYYARAILEQRTNQKELALKDLAASVRYGVEQCLDLTDAVEVSQVWSTLSSDEEFRHLQDVCAAKGLKRSSPLMQLVPSGERE